VKTQDPPYTEQGEDRKANLHASGPELQYAKEKGVKPFDLTPYFVAYLMVGLEGLEPSAN
jgi:hypothetical protein